MTTTTSHQIQRNAIIFALQLLGVDPHQTRKVVINVNTVDVTYYTLDDLGEKILNEDKDDVLTHVTTYEITDDAADR